MSSQNPPAITAVEGQLVGALSLWPERMDDLPPDLAASDFTDGGLAAIFAEMRRRHLAGQAMDVASVLADLPPRLADTLSEAQAGAATSEHVVRHAERVLAEGVRRQLAAGFDALRRDAQAPATAPVEIVASATALVEAAEARLAGSLDDDGMSARDGMRAMIAEAEAAARGEVVGLSTGFGILDANTGGLRPGEVWTIGARPGMGKSTLVSQFAMDAAGAGRHAVVVTLEMPPAQFWARIGAGQAGINGIRVREGNLSPAEWKRLTEAANETQRRLGDHLRIIRGRSSVDAILATLRRLHRRGQCDLAVIDFIQRADAGRSAGRTSNRNGELELISRRLADFAREHEIPVVICSQLSRAADGAVPHLGHLRDCGSLEADADVVLFIHRPDGSPKHARDLAVAKCRSGSVGALHLVLDPDRMRFRQATEAVPR
jgi:replicative DNA helicase